jgi:predicted NACHT family NTPase
MELKDEIDPATGEMVYFLRIAGIEPPMRFSSPEEREKFLYRLYLRLLSKLLRSQQMREALEWLWEKEREEMLLLRQNEEAWAQFVLLLLQQDQQYFRMPANLASTYMQQLARDWMVMILDFTLTSHRLVPVPADEDQPPRG